MRLPVGSLSPRRRDAVGLGVVALVWVGVLVLVATVGSAVVVQRVARTPVATRAPVTTATTTDARPDVALGPTDTTFPVDLPALLGLAPPTTDPDLGVSDPLKSTPPPPSWLPSLPVIQLPPLPKELDPILRVAAPTVRQACSTTGVVIVLAALVKGDLEGAGIPVTQALTYLAPVLSVCALFPSDQPSICAADTAINNAVIPKDLQILVGVPPLLALALDQVDSVVGLLRSTGLPLPPDVSQTVAKALGCDLE